MLSLLLLAAISTPPGPVILRDTGSELGPAALFVVDESRTLTAEDLLSSRADARLRPFGETRRGFGVTSAVLWVRAEVVSEVTREWALRLGRAAGREPRPLGGRTEAPRAPARRERAAHRAANHPRSRT